MKKYSHVFFDLDHTLWDFERNSRETLRELYISFNLCYKGIPTDTEFINIYRDINLHYWNLYHTGEATKELVRNRRFLDTLCEFQVYDEGLAVKLADAYIEICPTKPHLLPFATEVVQHLHEQYKLHIITNGFKETQYMKLNKSGLAPYFDSIVTSEEAECVKPNKKIFQYCLKKASATPEQCIMIGDNLLADIGGARNCDIDQVYYNPELVPHQEQVTYEVTCLSSIISLF